MKNHKKITKAVIAAAGYGTRFLPATKNQPKEMLPIIDKPIIQYLVEEAVASGIEDIILVTRSGQSIMEDYFDNNLALEYMLEQNGKEKSLEMVREIPQIANFVYVRQKRHLPYGNGTPLLAVENLIDDDESFVFMWGDDMTLSHGKPVTKQMMEVYEEQGATAVIAVQQVPHEEVGRYGIAEYKVGADYKYEVKKLHEKLPPEEAPSDMADYGRLILNYSAIKAAKKTSTGKGGELWMVDILNQLVDSGGKVIAQPADGEWLTTGDPLRYLITTIRFALERDDLSADLKKYIKSLNL